MIKVNLKKLFVLGLLTFGFSVTTVTKAEHIPLRTVEYVDVQKYLGKWYEIARFDQSFQRGCTATTAEYSLRRDGDIRVKNTCRKDSPNGKLKVAEGRAWIKDQKTNSKLKVQFFLKSLKLPLFSGNYWIIELDQDYQYAVVGDPSRKFLWILSRTVKMEDSVYDRLVNKAKFLGFDTSKLLVTVH